MISYVLQSSPDKVKWTTHSVLCTPNKDIELYEILELVLGGGYILSDGLFTKEYNNSDTYYRVRVL